ncbi:MAG: hypothetical protein LBH26_06585 [Treponema sp.]|jgi:hypothetical protein|nr:hypothetical protein [Treponema sp.]
MFNTSQLVPPESGRGGGGSPPEGGAARPPAAALLIFFLVFFSAALFPLPPQKTIYPGEWPYDALSALALEQRILLFTDSVITVSQAESMLAEIDEEALSPRGKELHRNLFSWLRGRPFISLGSGALSFEARPSVNPEFYFRSNKDIDFFYDNNKRRPFAELPLTLSFSPWISAAIDVAAEQKLGAAFFDENYTNFPAGDAFEFNIPRRAYLNLGAPFPFALPGEAPGSSGFRFAIGLGENFLGRTKTGSIILSEQMKYVSYGILTLYSPKIKYSANVMQLDVNKYFYFHHAEARFFKIASLSLVEGLMVNAPLELRFLNPLAIYHSFAAYSEYGNYKDDLPEGEGFDSGDSRVGSFFGMKLEIQPVKYLRFYALWALNELQTAAERQDDPDALKPDSMALQGGFELIVPAGDAYWSFGLEGVYTFPYVYVLRGKTWSFYKPGSPQPGEDIRFWTGSPFGPDTAAGALWAGRHGSRWSLSGTLVFAAQGERSGLAIFDDDAPKDYHPWRTWKRLSKAGDPGALDAALEETALVSPSGLPSLVWQFGVSLTWFPRNRLSISLEPAYTVVNNYGHIRGNTEHGFETALSIRYTPRPLR